MEAIKIKNEKGLELIVTNTDPENYGVISGGIIPAPDWEEYLDMYQDEIKPHFLLIRKAIEELGWVGEKADAKANDWCFVFSDGIALGFTWRAWGDMMSAIVGKNEGYMAYYM